MTATMPDGPDVGDAFVDRSARLVPGISVRREQFGGLIYSFHTRRLRVVRSRAAIEVALHLSTGGSVEETAAWLVAQGFAKSHAGARTFVISAIERFEELGVMSWTTT